MRQSRSTIMRHKAALGGDTCGTGYKYEEAGGMAVLFRNRDGRGAGQRIEVDAIAAHRDAWETQ